jgi:hypothetical protein
MILLDELEFIPITIVQDPTNERIEEYSETKLENFEYLGMKHIHFHKVAGYFQYYHVKFNIKGDSKPYISLLRNPPGVTGISFEGVKDDQAKENWLLSPNLYLDFDGWRDIVLHETWIYLSQQTKERLHFLLTGPYVIQYSCPENEIILKGRYE